MSRRSASVIALLIFASPFFAGDRAAAQEVQWRHDYTAARKEAAETGRPLLLDFGTESCFWCKKLDATTFRDPKVVKLLNERFIPVKIDAQKDARLADALRVESYPTLILATANGKVIGRQIGFADVAQLTALLQQAPAEAAPPAPPAPAAPTVPAVPAALSAPAPMTEAQMQHRRKAEIDAGLSALFPEIAAALDH